MNYVIVCLLCNTITLRFTRTLQKNPYEKTNLADLEPSRHSLRIRKLQPNGLPLPPTPSPEIKVINNLN